MRKDKLLKKNQILPENQVEKTRHCPFEKTMKRELAVGVAALCALMLVVIPWSSREDSGRAILKDTQLFIVPEADVLTGVGQINPQVKKAALQPVKTTMKRVRHVSASVAKDVNKVDNSKFKILDETPKWSRAMLKVQQQVMKQILEQRKQREKAAVRRAEMSYRNKLSSSLTLESRRTKELASREKKAIAHDQLQSIEDTQNAQTHHAYMQQNIQAKLSEISNERLNEETDGAQTLRHYAIVGSQGLHHLPPPDANNEDESGSTPMWLRTDA